MAIRVLPPQLANQIAAGEVVERPASIIKELIENSIDAGATRIDIDIEQGGCKLIRIRDNGCGINKDDLALALTRHATSKIQSLDDLEAIMSLGFRGEALASISSVSRLTLTSKTQEQAEAWQVYAEGRDMIPTIKPAAHPVGTTVEVLDIFYNTPARRRFLKTEKTEFSHIEEVIRRIALAYHHVSINLSHNGKLVKQYRSAQTEELIEKRLASVCGIAFMQKVIRLFWQHDDLTIQGWISPNAGIDLQYFYVNGRIVKDRLLNHALKQALQESNTSAVSSTDDTLSYVVYLTLDPHQVDVNVHPAKHEVRFHESRLVHDFVYQAMRMALESSSSLLGSDNQYEDQATSAHIQTRAAAGKSIFDQSNHISNTEHNLSAEAQRRHSLNYSKADNKINHISENKLYETLVSSPDHNNQNSEGISVEQKAVIESLFPKRTQDINIHLLDDNPPQQASATIYENSLTSVKTESIASAVTLGRVLTIVNNQFVLLERENKLSNQQFYLLSIKQAQHIVLTNKLMNDDANNLSEKLLIPLSLLLSKTEQKIINNNKPLLNSLGFQFVVDKEKLQLIAVPRSLRKINWQQLLPKLLSFLTTNFLIDSQSNDTAKQLLITELVTQYLLETQQHDVWNSTKVIQLLSALEQIQYIDLNDANLIKQVDLSAIISQFKHIN